MSASTPHAAAERPRILLVEDTADVRALLRRALEGEGYEVLEAADGVEAVEVAIRERPDAIVMDMSLPRLGGHAATRLIRQEPALSSVPVVACTAFNRWEWRGKSIVAGCDAFLTKPIDFGRLRAVLAELLARRRAPRPSRHDPGR